MAADLILRTYGDSSARDDVVLNAIEILTATEQQIFNMLPKSTALNMIHSYLTDTLPTAASLAVAEGADYTATALTTPTRLTNIVEVVAYNFKVSRQQRAIQHYQGEDELSRQTNKALKAWGNGAEFDLVRSTLTSGASGTIATMSGIIEATSKSTNHTSQTSGIVFNASILDGLMQNQYTNSNGLMATEVFFGAWLRTKMDQSIQKTNVVVNNIGMSDIVRTVSTYQNSFGTLSLRTHRYLQQGGDATARILAIRPEKLAIAFLEKPYIDTGLQRAGPYENRAVSGSFTVEVRNKDSHFFCDGFNLAL